MGRESWIAMCINRCLFSLFSTCVISSLHFSFEIFSSSPSAGRYYRRRNFVICGYVRQPRQTFPPLCATRRTAFASARRQLPMVRVVVVVVSYRRHYRRLATRRLIHLINETMPGLQIARARSSRIKSEQYCYCSLTSPYTVFQSLTFELAPFIARFFISVKN